VLLLRGKKRVEEEFMIDGYYTILHYTAVVMDGLGDCRTDQIKRSGQIIDCQSSTKIPYEYCGTEILAKIK